MKVRWLALALTALAAPGCVTRSDVDAEKPVATPAKHGEFANESLRVGRTTRVYRLFVPANIDLERPAPLVMAFHGMLIDSKDVMPKYTRLNETAERHGFIIVYPNALGGSFGLAPDKVLADIAFFDALLARLSATYRIDAERLYVLGMSNGGYFAHLLARERSTIIAAAASHSGPLGLQTLGGINAARKFPVLIVHGTADSIFPVAFARENAEKYRREGHVVDYIEVPGLGHAWANDANINERIWAFFAAHRRSSRAGRGHDLWPAVQPRDRVDSLVMGLLPGVPDRGRLPAPGTSKDAFRFCPSGASSFRTVAARSCSFLEPWSSI